MINDYPQALTIAGTDSGGGAGIPADVKTMQMRGVYSAMVVVAVTAQNTLGVQDALPMPEKLIDEQFASIAGDLKIRACKTGMLADPIRVRPVLRNLKKYDFLSARLYDKNDTTLHTQHQIITYALGILTDGFFFSLKKVILCITSDRRKTPDRLYDRPGFTFTFSFRTLQRKTYLCSLCRSV